MKTNEKHKTAVAAPSVAEPQPSTAPAAPNVPATPTVSAVPTTSAAPTGSAAYAATSQPEVSQVQSEVAGNASGKIPPLDLGEDRLTPVAAPIVRVDNPDSTVAADKVTAPKADADAFIKAIVSAIDIDARIAHALVDIHAGVDTAEAFGRAYGITLPTGKSETVSEVRPEHAAGAETHESDTTAAADASVARLPEQAASVPTFLCNPRRGFWD